MPGLTLRLTIIATARVLYGIRPERLDLVPLDTPGAMPGRVTALESTGTSMFVAPDTGGFTLNALFSDRPRLARGDQIALRPRVDHHTCSMSRPFFA